MAFTLGAETRKWRWMSDYVNMESAGTVTFLKGGAGQFHFGCVEAELDWRIVDDSAK